MGWNDFIQNISRDEILVNAIQTIRKDLEIHLLNDTEICVLGNFTNPHYTKFPLDLLDSFLNVFNKNPNLKMSLVEKKYKDSESKNVEFKKVLNKYAYTHRQLKFEDYTEIPTVNDAVFDSIYLPNEIINANIIIILAHHNIHTHHFLKYEYTAIEELGLLTSLNDFDWTQVTRKEAIVALRDDIKLVGESSLKILHKLDKINPKVIYTILDLRKVKQTNEHLFWSTIKNTRKIESGFLMQ